MSKKLLIAVVIVVLGLSWAYAQQQQAVDEKALAKAMVEKAAAFLNENGKEKTIAEINKPDGQFVQGELYVFAYDLNAVMLAHPKNPKLIGQSLMDKPDSKGKLFRKEIIDKAKSAGSGWVDYFYLNPQTGKEEAKTTYLKKAGDMVICCGAYR
ncbi:cache domain-containing protein [Syntrophobacter fumaroxidans]|uniref:Cache, type 2 domain protein n=1 Tax=Syntrophobacter fumaroxidans (strain DSM 10017 / MPOB) TaxID=335543 RepID=A0LF30_SYNFM|nr:cache domain-containing protein [Syntrophobacter fumaroxidans]ABK16032.1 Cache, type 2 domain protein [Syntrophobacter fumaroxidans MPOB]